MLPGYLSLNRLYEETENSRLRWHAKIKSILSDTGLSYLWHVQVADYSHCKSEIKSKCNDLFIDKWKDEVSNNSQCVFYKQIKSSPKIEKYITELSYDLRMNTIRFFIRGHHLPITLDRWNSATDTDRNCKKCEILGRRGPSLGQSCQNTELQQLGHGSAVSLPARSMRPGRGPSMS